MLPPFLKPNDQIRILSPSGSVDPEYIDGAKKTLSTWGLRCTEGRFARSSYGRFAGTDAERLQDLQEAINDPDVKAILCSRGGYGLARIVDKISFSALDKTPKWLIGFSDITVLHNAISLHKHSSLHAIMTKHIGTLSSTEEPLSRLREILFGNIQPYNIAPHPLNKTGQASGRLTGGNLSVLYGLRGTPFDANFDNCILFIEDIAERPYHIDRMIQNLRLAGVFDRIAGLIVGQFSDCEEDPTMNQTIHEIILAATEGQSYPICMNFPSGHVDYNLPLIIGEKHTLTVTQDGTSLTI